MENTEQAAALGPAKTSREGSGGERFGWEKGRRGEGGGEGEEKGEKEGTTRLVNRADCKHTEGDIAEGWKARRPEWGSVHLSGKTRARPVALWKLGRPHVCKAALAWHQQ